MAGDLDDAAAVVAEVVGVSAETADPIFSESFLQLPAVIAQGGGLAADGSSDSEARGLAEGLGLR